MILYIQFLDQIHIFPLEKYKVSLITLLDRKAFKVYKLETNDYTIHTQKY